MGQRTGHTTCQSGKRGGVCFLRRVLSHKLCLARHKTRFGLIKLFLEIPNFYFRKLYFDKKMFHTFHTCVGTLHH